MRSLSLAALLGASLVDPAAAWGCLGHMITAAIAYDAISDTTKAAVGELRRRQQSRDDSQGSSCGAGRRVDRPSLRPRQL
jgi:hypothetical protein